MVLAALLAGGCGYGADDLGAVAPAPPIVGVSDLPADISGYDQADVINLIFMADPVADAQADVRRADFVKDDAALSAGCPVEVRTPFPGPDFPATIDVSGTWVNADGSPCTTGTLTESGFRFGQLSGMDGVLMAAYTVAGQSLNATWMDSYIAVDDTGAGVNDTRTSTGINRRAAYDFATMEGRINGYDWTNAEAGPDGWMTNGNIGLTADTLQATTYDNLNWVISQGTGTGGADEMIYNGSFTLQDEAGGALTVTFIDVIVDAGSACVVDADPNANGQPVSGVINIEGAAGLGGEAATMIVNIPGNADPPPSPTDTVADCGVAEVLNLSNPIAFPGTYTNVILNWFQ